jgi:hypothetical protein
MFLLSDLLGCLFAGCCLFRYCFPPDLWCIPLVVVFCLTTTHCARESPHAEEHRSPLFPACVGVRARLGFSSRFLVGSARKSWDILPRGSGLFRFPSHFPYCTA